MSSDQRISNRLISAVSAGHLETARELSYSKAWSDGYALLLHAVTMNRTAVAELLLMSGSPVCSSNYEPADTPLHFAALHANIHIVKMLLNKGADINAKNQYGKTPLYNVIDNVDNGFKQDKLDVIELLLKHKADVNAGDNDGTSPLHVAVKRRCLKTIELLLEYGVNVNCVMHGAKWNKNYAPLHYAVEYDLKEAITLLLSRGANVDIKEEGGFTPLHIAAEKGYAHIADKLLSYGACINSLTLEEEFTPLHIACKQRCEEIVKLLLDRGADINASTKGNLTPLHVAIKKQDVEIINLLLKNGAKIDDKDKVGQTALQLAAEEGCLMIVENILKYYSNIDNQSRGISLKTVMHDSTKEIVQSLLQYGLNINHNNTNNATLLHVAVEEGYLKIVEGLLKNGIDVNTLLPNSIIEIGFTPLHSAVKNKQEEIAKLLISYEADINAQDIYEKTPIFYAIQNADLIMTKLLLSNKANVKDDPELLNSAVKTGCIKIIELLLQLDIDVNAKRMDGTTALHIACFNYHHEVIEVLIKYGANINAQDDQGRTALHVAFRCGHNNVVETLLEHDSDVNILSRTTNGKHLTAFEYAINEIVRLEEYNSDFSKVWLFSKVCTTFGRHLIKMITANFYVSRKNLPSMKFLNTIDFQIECEKEIARMKSEKINDANICFHDILARDINLLTKCMRNENVVQVLKSDDYKSKFPMYSSMIKNYFRKAMKRKELLDQANKFLYFLFNNLPDLPHDCTDKILSYLSDEDIRYIMDAFNKPLSINNSNTLMMK